MARKNATLVITRGSINVIVGTRAKRDPAISIPIEVAADWGDWVEQLRRAGEALRQGVKDSKLAGAAVTVLYRSPSQAIAISSVPSRSSGAATDAALLEVTDSLPYSAATALAEAIVIGRDRAEAEEDQRTHVLVAADRAEVAEAIAHLVESSGMNVQSIVSLDAPIARSVARHVLADKGTSGCLYIGQAGGFFAVGREGSLAFDRRIDVGVDTLITALRRPIRTDAGPVALDRDEALRILTDHGIPRSEGTVSEDPPLSASEVMPVLQPVLQRFLIEMRQSLRFGIDETIREGLVVRVAGPGAMIPNLDDLVSSELGVDATVDQKSIVSEVELALADRACLSGLNMVPRRIVEDRGVATFRRRLWAGGAAALALIVFDMIGLDGELSTVQGQLRVLQAELEMATMDGGGPAMNAESGDAREVFESILRRDHGARVRYDVCMHELGMITPEAVRFTSIDFTAASGGARGSVGGYSVADGADPSEELQVFIGALEESGLFTNVQLGRVQVASADGLEALRFDIVFMVPPVADPVYLGLDGARSDLEAGGRDSEDGTPEGPPADEESAP